MPTKPQKPVHQIRIGSIKAAIWENRTENGARYNTTFSRLFKDGDSWKMSDSFGRDDLLVLRKVSDCAHSWICDQTQGTEDKTNDNSPS